MRAVNLFKIGRVSWLAAEKRAQEKDRRGGGGGGGRRGNGAEINGQERRGKGGWKQK